MKPAIPHLLPLIPLLAVPPPLRVRPISLTAVDNLTTSVQRIWQPPQKAELPLFRRTSLSADFGNTSQVRDSTSSISHGSIALLEEKGKKNYTAFNGLRCVIGLWPRICSRSENSSTHQTRSISRVLLHTSEPLEPCRRRVVKSPMYMPQPMSDLPV